MNTKTDEGLYEKARKLFISKASIDEFAGTRDRKYAEKRVWK